MPYLRLIDTDTRLTVGAEIVGHTVTDRDGARAILAYDLKNTADPTWAAEILAKFDAGENAIEVCNGTFFTFRIEYLENANA